VIKVPSVSVSEAEQVLPAEDGMPSVAGCGSLAVVRASPDRHAMLALIGTRRWLDWSCLGDEPGCNSYGRPGPGPL
jgi:hypothetical protein